MSLFNSDIYDISTTINEIQKNNTPDVSEETLSMGIFGYTNDVFSNMIQNAVISSAEYANESFPIRAKFDKSILTYAVMYDIKNIHATPAYMQIMIGLLESELEMNSTNGIFTIDKGCSIMLKDFEYHLDYDLVVKKNVLFDGTIVYSAQYDIDRINVLSDITNPYLPPPISMNIDGNSFIFITCYMRQVTYGEVYRKIMTNNILENKTIDFEFDQQLASFDVVVNDGTNDIYLTPIFEGMPLNGIDLYCYYTFIDSNTIRVRFERDSYEPKMNSQVKILLKTTRGAEGNFSYKDDIIQTLESPNVNYNNISILIKPITGSVEGMDRKSKDILREIIPKEILSRGNITNNRDLENFFNSIDDNKLKFYKRRNNQFERLYYAYLLVKDFDNNIIPANTINLAINENQFDSITTNRNTLNTGNMIDYSANIGSLVDVNIYTPDQIAALEQTAFMYSLPFKLVVNKNALSVSYYLDVFKYDYNFKFAYINMESPLQFITSGITCKKIYLEGDSYKLDMSIVQNLDYDFNLVTQNSNGDILSSDIVPVIELKTELNTYYKFGTVTGYNSDINSYDIQFDLESDNIITENNTIKIDDILVGGTTANSYAYFGEDVEISVYIYAKLDKEYGRGDADTVVPNMEDYTLCNRYDSYNNIVLFVNYSGIIRSTVEVEENLDGSYRYNIKGVPVIKYSYLSDATRYLKFIDSVQYRKVYIDEAIRILEDGFAVDLKFFNTYGPSKMFKIGHSDEILDKVNISITFRIKLVVGADKNTPQYIKDEIKRYIENINSNVLTNIHMTTLSTDLMNMFEGSVDYIEFLGINNYNALYQYIEKQELENIEDVPEFLNINATVDYKPDINIILV